MIFQSSWKAWHTFCLYATPWICGSSTYWNFLCTVSWMVLPASVNEAGTGRMLTTSFLFSLEVPSITSLLGLIQLDLFHFPVILRLKLFLPSPFREVYFWFEWCLYREKSPSIIGMPLVFPWTLGLRTLASLGAITFVQRWRWGFCIPDIVLPGVQGSSPTQILSRNVLMSGFSCVLPAHV